MTWAVELVGKGTRGGKREAFSTASGPVRRRRIAHKSTALVSALYRKSLHSPSALGDDDLVGELLGVQVLAFVGKPEQLPETNSNLARRGYDERDC